MLNNNFQELISEATGATEIFKISTIQSLWSGYGEIMRYGLKGCKTKSVIVKHVRLANQSHHPRGWNTNISHQRKIKSYQVETNWYKDWAGACDQSCRIAHCLALGSETDEVLIVLEDLDDSGYAERRSSVSMSELQACLLWLANFHARFMGKKPTGLWPVGTYWHLDTRPDELEALDDNELKQAARAIDQILQSSPYQTIVHGDAKLANFCFSANGQDIAAVDFQYVGAGCGMKDVAYFIGSCLYDEDCERYEAELLDFYFLALKKSLGQKKSSIDPHALEQNWRSLYHIAWTDFHRFMKGWSPGHWKVHGYSERIARQVVLQIHNNTLPSVK